MLTTFDMSLMFDKKKYKKIGIYTGRDINYYKT